MATLELDVAEEAATQPARKGRRLGILFWAAIGWLIRVRSERVMVTRRSRSSAPASRRWSAVIATQNFL
ncbi:MAG: hypothetical protein ABWY82_26775, partial [Tardiphaga sp.]